MSYYYPMKLALISHKIGPVSPITPPHVMEPGMPPMDLSFMLGPQTVATHTFATAPPLDVLLMPGGLGTVAIAQTGDRSIETFLRERFNVTDYVLSVCNGASSLARAGVLDGRRATTNKLLWSTFTGSFARELGTAGNITWVPSARWVEDGKVWTSSGVAAGIDMTLAFLRKIYGAEKPDLAVNAIEYAPHTDPHWDPFSVVHKVSALPRRGDAPTDFEIGSRRRHEPVTGRLRWPGGHSRLGTAERASGSCAAHSGGWN